MGEILEEEDVEEEDDDDGIRSGPPSTAIIQPLRRENRVFLSSLPL